MALRLLEIVIPEEGTGDVLKIIEEASDVEYEKKTAFSK